MIKLHTSPSLPEIVLLKGHLEQEGIPCVLRKDQLTLAVGEVPVTEAWPELWIVDEANAARAEEILAYLMSGAGGGTSWVCVGCGEESEGQFAACWNCGSRRP